MDTTEKLNIGNSETFNVHSYLVGIGDIPAQDEPVRRKPVIERGGLRLVGGMDWEKLA